MTASHQPSLIQGIPLTEEPGLGALTLPGFLREVTEHYADREALVLRTSEGAMRWSYAELWERAVEIARALLACGSGKDSRIGLLMTNRPEWLSAFFGVGLAGGVAVTLSTFSTLPEFEYLLQETGVSILLFERSVARKDFAAMLIELEPDVLRELPGQLRSTKFPFLRRLVMLGERANARAIDTWPAFLAHAESTPRPLVQAAAATVKPSDAAAVFLSSGSTGRPKGIVNAHRGIAIQCWRARRIFALQDDVRSWTANGFSWSGNFMMTLGGTLAAGGTIVLQRLFNPEEALELVQAERVTWPQMWPHQWAQLEGSANWKSTDLSSLKYVDPSRPASRHPTFRADPWTDPNWCYGNTETFTISAAFAADTPPEIAAGSHGEALPGNTIKVVDPETGEVVPIGRPGEIAVKGPTLMLGYLGVSLSDTLDEAGFFHTGDAGYIDERGRLHFEGRLTEVIKTGGANVSPLEVDTVLATNPGVKIAKTVGVPHATLGELVVSCIVPHPGSELSEAEVREFLRGQLASYKVPRRVLFVREEELSLTGSAKIKASVVRELVVKRLAAA